MRKAMLAGAGMHTRLISAAFAVKGIETVSAVYKESKEPIKSNEMQEIKSEPKPEEQPYRASKSELRSLKNKGYIILPASFLYPQLVGTVGFNPTARVKVMKEHFKNL